MINLKTAALIAATMLPLTTLSGCYGEGTNDPLQVSTPTVVSTDTAESTPSGSASAVTQEYAAVCQDPTTGERVPDSQCSGVPISGGTTVVQHHGGIGKYIWYYIIWNSLRNHSYPPVGSRLSGGTLNPMNGAPIRTSTMKNPTHYTAPTSTAGTKTTTVPTVKATSAPTTKTTTKATSNTETTTTGTSTTKTSSTGSNKTKTTTTSNYGSNTGSSTSDDSDTSYGSSDSGSSITRSSTRRNNTNRYNNRRSSSSRHR